jgi:hypothetical protein
MNPHDVTERFEEAVAEYTGATYAVATTSCTMGLFLALQFVRHKRMLPSVIDCPRYTYIGVAQSIVHAGAMIRWTNEEWQASGFYRLGPTPVIDTARLFTQLMFAELMRNGDKLADTMAVTSHHWSKTLGLEQGGCILTDSREAYEWLRRARFDGRTPGVAPIADEPILGWHAYMSPEVAASGLMRLSFLPDDNDPLPEPGYVDLSTYRCFAPYTYNEMSLGAAE